MVNKTCNRMTECDGISVDPVRLIGGAPLAISAHSTTETITENKVAELSPRVVEICLDRAMLIVDSRLRSRRGCEVLAKTELRMRSVD